MQFNWADLRLRVSHEVAVKVLAAAVISSLAGLEDLLQPGAFSSSLPEPLSTVTPDMAAGFPQNK